MPIRLYQPKDYDALQQALELEGVASYEFASLETYVIEEEYLNVSRIIGFFTLYMCQNYPALRHFCVIQRHRSLRTARQLVKTFRKVVRAKGFKKAIINTECGNEKMAKIIGYYFKTDCYAEQDGMKYYFVEV